MFGFQPNGDHWVKIVRSGCLFKEVPEFKIILPERPFLGRKFHEFRCLYAIYKGKFPESAKNKGLSATSNGGKNRAAPPAI